MKTKNYFLLLAVFALISSVNLFSQTAKFDTSGSFGSGDADEPRFAVLDEDNNYYVVGQGKGIMMISSEVILTGRGAADAFVVKYNEDMDVQWANYVGGTRDESFESVAVASNGDVYAVGKVRSASTIDGTEAMIAATNDQDGMIVVFDKDGAYKTHKTIVGTADVGNKISGNAICYSIVIDETDNVYVTGSTIGNTDFGNGKSLAPLTTGAVVYVAKYNTDLECQWVIEGNSGDNSASVDWPMSMNLDKNNNIIFAGRYATQIDITGTNGNTVSNSTAGTSTGFIAKINPAGECQWVKAISCAESRIDMKGVACDSKGNVGVIGFSNGKVTPEGQAEYAFAGNIDIFFVRLSASGTYVDGFAYGGPGRDEGKGITFDNNDNVYLAGNMNGANDTGSSVNMNPKGNTAVNKTFYGHDGFYAKYSGETLELLQVEKTATPATRNNQHEVAFNVALSKDDCRVYTLGYFNNAETIFDGDGGSVTLPNVGTYDIYWTIYSSCFSIKTSSLPNGKIGEMYFASIEVGNPTGSITCSVVEGSLPPGVTMDPSGSISGTPTERGRFDFTIKVQDSQASQEKELFIIITDAQGCDVFIRTDACPDAHLNVPYSFQIDIAGENYTCTLKSGSLPTGLTLSESGLISGTPTGGENMYRFTVEAKKDEACFDEIDLAMIVDAKSGIGELVGLNNFTLYPIPANGQFTLNSAFDTMSDIEVDIIMPAGISVWNKTFKNVDRINETIRINDFASGIYFVVLKNDEGKAVRRLIVK